MDRFGDRISLYNKLKARGCLELVIVLGDGVFGVTGFGHTMSFRAFSG